MKKIRIFLFTLLAIMTLVIFGASHNQKANAKTKYISAFPKSMYGSWYVYTKHKNLNRLIIKKHHIYVSTYNGEKSLYTDTWKWKLRKPFSKKYIDYILVNSFNSKKNLDEYGADILSFQANYTKKLGHKWLFLFQSFHQGGFNRNGFLNISKINGKSILSYMVLVPTSHNSYAAGTLHFTRSRKLAKQMIGKKIKGFRYRRMNNPYFNIF